MSNHFTHAGKSRAFAALLDLCLAGLLSVQTEKVLGFDPAESAGSVLAMLVGLLFMTCKDCVGGASPGKRLFGCLLINESTLQPATPSLAFKRNGRLYGTAAAIVVVAYALASTTGEMIATTIACFLLIGLFVRFASKIDSSAGTVVVRHSSITTPDPKRPHGENPKQGDPNRETSPHRNAPPSQEPSATTSPPASGSDFPESDNFR